MRNRIFINYRQDDTGTIVGHMYERLKASFPGMVFRDLNAIRPGGDIKEEVAKALYETMIMLIIIGPKWSSIADERGVLRLNNPNDMVRIEIELGLSEPQIEAIAVIFDDTCIPDPTNLPDRLQGLFNLRYLQIHSGEKFDSDMNLIIDTIKREIDRRRPVMSSLLSIALGLVLMGAGIVLPFLAWGNETFSFVGWEQLTCGSFLVVPIAYFFLFRRGWRALSFLQARR